GLDELRLGARERRRRCGCRRRWKHWTRARVVDEPADQRDRLGRTRDRASDRRWRPRRDLRRPDDLERPVCRSALGAEIGIVDPERRRERNGCGRRCDDWLDLRLPLPDLERRRLVLVRPDGRCRRANERLVLEPTLARANRPVVVLIGEIAGREY